MFEFMQPGQHVAQGTLSGQDNSVECGRWIVQEPDQAI